MTMSDTNTVDAPVTMADASAVDALKKSSIPERADHLLRWWSSPSRFPFFTT